MPRWCRRRAASLRGREGRRYPVVQLRSARRQSLAEYCRSAGAMSRLQRSNQRSGARAAPLGTTSASAG